MSGKPRPGTDAPEYVRPSGRNQWLVSVWVQPGAKRDEPAGEYQGRVKIRLRAPAVDNKANKALVRYMAELLGLKKNQVALESGIASRSKTLRIESAAEPVWSRMAPDRSPEP